MKVNNKILSIPPYISTAWRNISSLRKEADALVVELFNGSLVTIPNLDEEALSTIFSAHENYLEAEVDQEGTLEQALSHFHENEQMMGLPLRFGMDGMESAMAHDPSQMDAPDLPPEILEKIAGISQVLGVESVAALPQAEQDCNCFHCQIARAISHAAEPKQEEAVEEEEVSDEELTFREWDIEEVGENLYNVSKPLDKSVQYRVFLGEPVGCTCGQERCEHIEAVLKS